TDGDRVGAGVVVVFEHDRLEVTVGVLPGDVDRLGDPDRQLIGRPRVGQLVVERGEAIGDRDRGRLRGRFGRPLVVGAPDLFDVLRHVLGRGGIVARI